MACEEKSYPNIDESSFTAIRKELSKIDLELPEDYEGEITSKAYGVTASYLFDPAIKTLKVKVVSKPFFVPCSYIYNKLSEAFERVTNGS